MLELTDDELDEMTFPLRIEFDSWTINGTAKLVEDEPSQESPDQQPDL
jgi:hypothetical protein